MATGDLKHVHRKKAKGRVYVCFRPTGERFDAPYGTAAFLIELKTRTAAWDALQATRKANAPPPAPAWPPGSVGRLLADYKDSPEFRTKSDETKASYHQVFEILQPCQAMPTAQLDRPFLLQLRKLAFKPRRHKRTRQLGPERWWLANYVVTVVSALWSWGRQNATQGGQAYVTTANPADDVQKLARPKRLTEMHRPWAAEEYVAMLQAATDRNWVGLRTAMALGWWAGYRISDAIRADDQSWRGGLMRVRQKKTGKMVWGRAPDELRTVVQGILERGKRLVRTQGGAPYSRSGLQTMLYRLAKDLEAEGKVAPGLNFHGLRHSVGTELANLGMSEDAIAAMLGTTVQAARVYTRNVDRERLANVSIDALTEARRRRSEER